jgi:transcriptional regulator with XRE-family HTH domain
MSVFHERLKEERKRLGLNQTEFAVLGGVTVDSQGNYERGSRKPDSAYLEALATHGVDVGYLFTGLRMPVPIAPAASGSSSTPALDENVMRAVTREQAALLDNYDAADEKGRAAARSVLDALAQPKRANG